MTSFHTYTESQADRQRGADYVEARGRFEPRIIEEKEMSSRSTRRWRHRTIARYYLGRRWKITWVEVLDRGRLIRTVKHYERRTGVGCEWSLVRSIVALAEATP